jgi:dynein heavy chain
MLLQMVTEYKDSLSKVQENCTHMSETIVLSIRKKKVYKDEEFLQRQQVHREKVRERLKRLNTEIQSLMKSTYEVFRYDSDSIQMEWHAFLMKIDKLVEVSLRTMVKRSLQELSKSINGDGKSDVYPLFLVQVVLEMNRVQFKPSLEELTNVSLFVDYCEVHSLYSE